MRRFVKSNIFIASGALLLGFCFITLWIYLLIPINKELIEPNESIIIFDQNKQKLYEILQKNQEKSQYIEYEQISSYFIKAIVATEDKRFYKHNGVDYLGVSRAIKDNILIGRVVSGASTISQQLARNILKNKNRGLKTKIEETLFAMRLEKQFSKEKILELYANKVSFGGVLIGIESASWAIFDKPASNLDLAEASFLAGIPKSPTKYSPFDNFKETKKRQEFVLKRMLEENLINQVQYNDAINEELKINKEQNPIKTPHFVFYLLNEKQEEFEKAKKENNKIYTTINAGLQEQVEDIINSHLELIGKQHNISNSAVLVFEAKTGKILVMAGSKDYFDDNIDGNVNVLLAKRQVGSTLKPFLYLLAFMELGWNEKTTILDEPVAFETSVALPWEPKNYDLDYRGEVSVREALAQSLNIPATKTLNEVGTNKFLVFLQKLGMFTVNKNEDYGLSVALGTPDIRPIDLAYAYGLLAREGKNFEFQVIENENIFQGEQILPKNKVLEITDILSDNQARIDAFGENSVLDFDYSVAVKTGTTRNFRDNYCIGYTSEVVVLVWVGNSDGSNMRNVSGITGAGPLFHKIMNLVMENYEKKNFPEFQENENETSINNNLRILSPLNGSIYQISDQELENQKIKLEANEKCNWYVNNKKIGTGKKLLWLPKKGTWDIKAKNGTNETSIRIYVM